MKIFKKLNKPYKRWKETTLKECIEYTEGNGYQGKGTVKDMLELGQEVYTPFALYKSNKKKNKITNLPVINVNKTIDRLKKQVNSLIVEGKVKRLKTRTKEEKIYLAWFLKEICYIFRVPCEFLMSAEQEELAKEYIMTPKVVATIKRIHKKIYAKGRKKNKGVKK